MSKGNISTNAGKLGKLTLEIHFVSVYRESIGCVIKHSLICFGKLVFHNVSMFIGDGTN